MSEINEFYRLVRYFLHSDLFALLNEKGIVCNLFRGI